MSDLSRLCALKQTLLLDKALVVDFEAERLVGCKEIGAIDEQRNLVGGRWHSGADLLQKLPQVGPANSHSAWILAKAKKSRSTRPPQAMLDNQIAS